MTIERGTEEIILTPEETAILLKAKKVFDKIALISETKGLYVALNELIDKWDEILNEEEEYAIVESPRGYRASVTVQFEQKFKKDRA